jgi:magnesium transporter
MSKNRPHRSRARRRRRHPPGTSPGTVTIDPQSPRPDVQAIGYGPEVFLEEKVTDVGRLRELRGTVPVLWVNLDGLGDAGILNAIAELFQLHPLAVEDAVNIGQRPKFDDYGEHCFAAIRMPRPEGGAHSEQLGLFLGKDFVVTFQDVPGDCLDPVRNRLRQGKTRMRSSGPDYLAYSLLDTVIDAYFPILESYADRLLVFEQRLLEAERRLPEVRELHDMRRDLLGLRGSIRPLREMVNALLHVDSDLVGEKTRVYLRDSYDHAVELIDLLEDQRDLVNGLMDLYLANLNSRLNEVIKVLTMIATIFIPLSFVAGVYGMNFNPAASPWNMPELNWRWGYPFSLALMAAMVAGMLVYFRRKGWLGK